jgi:DNA-binding HxlR family transcriptional regulator
MSRTDLQSTQVRPSEAQLPGRRARTGPRAAAAVLIVAVALVPLVLPQWTSFLIVVGLYYLVVIGLDLFEGQAGQVSLGQTMFFGIGAYGAGILSMRYDVPTLAALVISAAVSGILAFLLGRPFLRLRGYYLALATLSLAVIAVDMALPWDVAKCNVRTILDRVVETTAVEKKTTPRDCPIAASLEVLGERWTLLAIRELNYGVHRFEQIVQNTGASRDKLADRLRKLERAGIIERRQYNERPARFEYHLTPAGAELAPVLLGLAMWGTKWVWGLPEESVVHDCGHALSVDHVCRHCGGPVTRHNVTLPELPERRD